MKQLALYISVGVSWQASQQFSHNLISAFAVTQAVATDEQEGYFNAKQ